MEHVIFDDKCEIQRATGALDECGEPVTRTIYKGECLYLEAGANIFGVITLNPVLFVPLNGVKGRIDINDIVSVTTWRGRKIKSLVKVPRNIWLRRARQAKIARLELKQAIEE